MKKRVKDIITMSNIKKIVVVLLLLVAFSAKAQEKKWTLQACVDYALENNILVVQGQNTILSSQQDVIATKGQFLPSVNAGLSQNTSFGSVTDFRTGFLIDQTSQTTNANLNANQTLFNGFRLLNQYKQSQLSLETNQLELNRVKQDVSLNVVNAYLNVVFNIENLDLAKAQYQFSEKQLEQVKALVSAGVQPEVNVFDAKATLGQDFQRLTVAQNNYDLALLSLSQLLQIPSEGFLVAKIEVVVPSSELLYDSAKPIVDYALENRFEIKVAEKNIENAALSTQIAKSGFLPMVTMGYSFGSRVNFNNVAKDEKSFFNQLNNQKTHNLNLNINVPIFSQFSNRTNVAKLKIQEENAKLGLEQSKLTVEANVLRAFADAKAAYKTYEASKLSVTAQKIAFNNAKERYDIGVMNNFDLEQSRLRLLNAEASLVNAKFDFIFKTKVLDFYLGKPITD